MRREYINYITELPVKISLMNMQNYPIHWHDSIEIIFSLYGKISVIIETGRYEIEAGEIEIINCDEAHSIKALDANNKVLMLHIDPNFFEKFYNDIRNMFFYTNSSYYKSQEEEKYHVLRRLLSILVYEAVRKQQDYEDHIKDTLVELLYHLINNFHQLIYEKDDLKENEEQFERYDRIVRYIYNNYKYKISLQDIAKKEFLSSNYLSHEIKNMVGYSFNDFLNLTRVEESIKPLLDTDKTVSEISEELGFSHIRYFNKHFKKHYKCTPFQYRKRYKVSEKAYEKLKIYNELPAEEALDCIYAYIEDYDRYNYDDRIIKIDIDAALPSDIWEHDFNYVIDGGQAFKLLKEDTRKQLSRLQEDIAFKYIMLDNLFSLDMGFITNRCKIYNWYCVKNLIDFLLSVELRPIILIDEKISLDLLKSFIGYFRGEYGDYELGKWKFCIKKQSEARNLKQLKDNINGYLDIIEYEFKEASKDYIYDTCYMLPYIIHNSVNNKPLCFKAFDNFEDSIYMDNELFAGDNALINQMGINKPSYYAYYLLCKLGDNLIEKGEGYVITKQEDDIQIFLYSYSEEIDKLVSYNTMLKSRGIKKTAERKFSLNIINLSDDYEIIKYEINEQLGSAYDYWLSLGKPSRISDEGIKLLKSAAHPLISFHYAKKSNILNIVTRVQGYGAVLIILKKVQKHLN